jgi:hypothetical protein
VDPLYRPELFMDICNTMMCFRCAMSGQRVEGRVIKRTGDYMNLEQSPLYLQLPNITCPGLTSATMHVTTGHTYVLSAGKSEVYGYKAVKKG